MMSKNYFIALGCLLCILVLNVDAQESAQDLGDKTFSSRPDAHAPINIMGDHYHKKNEFMLSYRIVHMGSSFKIDGSGVYDKYMVAPETMQMNMQMLGVMYAPSDGITIMLMAGYMLSKMDLKMKNGTKFSTESQGLGDISINGLVKLMKKNNQSLHGNIGLSMPIGSIDQRDDLPTGSDAQLAYPMQLGSGTWDPTVGVTYVGKSDQWSWGLQPKYTFRVGENSEKYTIGNKLNIAAWGAIKASNYLSFSLSTTYTNMGAISGVDKDLNPAMMPLFDTANSGRSLLNMGVGCNVLIPSGTFENLRFGGAFNLPVYQSVEGFQMEKTWMLTLGIQYAL